MVAWAGDGLWAVASGLAWGRRAERKVGSGLFRVPQPHG
jgi:hypothetical protein